jgi:hypothetical protein
MEAMEACVCANCKDYNRTSEASLFYSRLEQNLAKEKIHVIPMRITEGLLIFTINRQYDNIALTYILIIWTINIFFLI